MRALDLAPRRRGADQDGRRQPRRRGAEREGGVSGKPIKFVGTGEKLEALEPFYPDRIASRILGARAAGSLRHRCSMSCVRLWLCDSTQPCMDFL